jgi:glutamate carboxypeptidase
LAGIQEQILFYLEQTEQQAFALLEDLVNINSFTTNSAGVNQVQDRIEAVLKPLGVLIERHPRSGLGDVLIARTEASKSISPVMLLGHADTVYPPGSEPSKFSRLGDTAVGPGTMDMKGGVVAMLWALQSLHAVGSLQRVPAVLLINCDEEIGSKSSKELIQSEARKARAALVFESGRPSDLIVTRRKAVSTWRLRAYGRSAHAGNNHKGGVNAITAMARVVARIDTLTSYDRGITLNVGLVTGGSASNTVPEYAEAIIDLRALSDADYAEASDNLKMLGGVDPINGARIEIEELHAWAAMQETEASLKLLEDYRRYSKPAGLEYERLPYIVGGGSDGNITSGVGTPTIDGLGPYGENPHAPSEFVRLTSLRPKVINLALYLESLAA